MISKIRRFLVLAWMPFSACTEGGEVDLVQVDSGTVRFVHYVSSSKDYLGVARIYNNGVCLLKIEGERVICEET